MQNEKGHAAACLNETFRQNADSPYLDRVRTGDGRSFLGSSQPGTRTPSQSGFRHRNKCFLGSVHATQKPYRSDRNVRELPLTLHSVNR